MKGDFSRYTFDPKKHYSAVLTQQGRVQVDADPNEQQAINQYRIETETKDVIGLCGVPEIVGGFEISVLNNGWDLAISPGRIYVDGILCELEEMPSVSAIELVEANNAGIGVKVSALTVDGYEFQKHQWIEIVGKDLFGKDILKVRVLITGVDPAAGVLRFNNTSLSNEDLLKKFNEASDRRVRRITTYTTQPDYPDPDFTEPSNNDNPPRLKLESGKTYLVYLDVWQHHVTALDDPRIREVALGGPDTNTRLKTVWQVKILPVVPFDPEPTLIFLQELKDKLRQRVNQPSPDRNLRRTLQKIDDFLREFSSLTADFRLEKLREILNQVGSNPEGLTEDELRAIVAEIERLESPFQGTCSMIFPEWDELTAPSTGTLNARTQTPQTDDNPCLLPPEAGYQRLENQLYRVEIHQEGTVGIATFKWSRDNGSVVTSVLKISGSEVTVKDFGLDDVLGFANGQWSEILDDQAELSGRPGQLVQITSVDPARKVLTTNLAPTLLANNPDGVNSAFHPKLRRWDQTGVSATQDGVRTAPGWIPLEGGIKVQFSEGTYKVGDYWLIPARTATGEIEWPPYVPNTNPIPQPSLGIQNHYCRLAILKFDDEILSVEQDCRKRFPPLTGLSAIHVIDVLVSDGNSQFVVPLKNDGEIPVDVLVRGLRVVCDRNIDPDTIGRPNQPEPPIQPNPICFVTLDLPFPINSSDRDLWGTTGIGYQPITLSALINVSQNVISWNPMNASGNWLQDEQIQQRLISVMSDFGNRLLAKLTLKGNFIWAASDPQMYLDGEAFGTARGETAHNLRLPSGDGRRGGDFEMWFWLVPPVPPIRLISLTINPSNVNAGRSSQGTVTLSRQAPDGGIVVRLSSSNVDRATVPLDVRVLAGQTSANFDIQTIFFRGRDIQVDITATFAEEERTAILTVEGAGPA